MLTSGGTWRRLGALLFLSALGAIATESKARGQTDASVDEKPLSGPALFQQRGCVQCHMVHGNGGGKGPDLTHVGSRRSETQLRRQILKGGGMMPPYEEALPPAEVARLVHYLRALR